MKHATWIFLGIVVAFAAYIFYFGVYRPAQKSQPITNQAARAWQTKTDEQGPVSVTITPRAIGRDLPQWTFEVAFNTHTRSLDQDPANVTTLVDDQSREIKPVSWNGPGAGGHHRSGILTFNAIQPFPKNIEIKIRDVGGIAERSFTWNLK